MILAEAQAIAERVRAILKPYCIRCEIAGSIRRRKAEVNDIEIVAIPKPYEALPLFVDGIALVVNQWPKVKGELPCKYTRRRLPEGIELDLFFATPQNWGFIYAIRTGSRDFSGQVLGRGWVRNGYHGIDGMLHKDGIAVPTPEEFDLFRAAGVPWIPPEQRI